MEEPEEEKNIVEIDGLICWADGLKDQSGEYLILKSPKLIDKWSTTIRAYNNIDEIICWYHNNKKEFVNMLEVKLEDSCSAFIGLSVTVTTLNVVNAITSQLTFVEECVKQQRFYHESYHLHGPYHTWGEIWPDYDQWTENNKTVVEM